MLCLIRSVGCATTMVAADRLQRSWVGIDISPKAAELVVKRIKDEAKDCLRRLLSAMTTPKRTDMGGHTASTDA